jgi:hypothetical protein
MGLVSQLVPSRSEPSGMVITMPSRSWAETVIRMGDLWMHDDAHTFHKLIIFRLELFE